MHGYEYYYDRVVENSRTGKYNYMSRRKQAVVVTVKCDKSS